MKGLRNVVAHEYGFIDYHIVWRALSNVLPDDAATIESILEGLKTGMGTTGRRRPSRLRPV